MRGCQQVSKLRGFSKGREDNDLSEADSNAVNYAKETYGCSDPIVIEGLWLAELSSL